MRNYVVWAWKPSLKVVLQLEHTALQRCAAQNLLLHGSTRKVVYIETKYASNTDSSSDRDNLRSPPQSRGLVITVPLRLVGKPRFPWSAWREADRGWPAWPGLGSPDWLLSNSDQAWFAIASSHLKSRSDWRDLLTL